MDWKLSLGIPVPATFVTFQTIAFHCEKVAKDLDKPFP